MYLKKDLPAITRRDLLDIPTAHLSKMLGLDESSTNRFKLAVLGVPTNLKNDPMTNADDKSHQTHRTTRHDDKSKDH
jgi:hypothetical protein